MSEQYKYEPIFGDQSLFDGAPEECFCVAKNVYDHRVFYKVADDCLFWLEGADWKHMQFMPCTPLAMRRIIRTPIWTVEDQKAGRLPDVGWVVTTYDTKRYVFVGESCHENQWSLRDAESGKVYHTPITWVLPIESPEEKAARLREEWVDSAITETEKRKDTTTDEYERLKARVKDIYDALLSGDLPVPVKGE